MMTTRTIRDAARAAREAHEAKCHLDGTPQYKRAEQTARQAMIAAADTIRAALVADGAEVLDGSGQANAGLLTPDGRYLTYTITSYGKLHAYWTRDYAGTVIEGPWGRHVERFTTNRHGERCAGYIHSFGDGWTEIARNLRLDLDAPAAVGVDVLA